MKEEEVGLDKESSGWGNVWPFLGALILAVANVDWVLIPFVFPLIFDTFWSTAWAAQIVANIEIFGWYKFWRWFFIKFLPKRRRVRETIDFTKELTQELKERGYVALIVLYFEKQFEWAVNPNQWAFKALKAGSHFGMFFLGFEPFSPGGRFVGVVFCVTTGWARGLYSLCLGNIIHVFISIGSWELIFKMLNWVKDLIF